ncbi:tripartite tricarboxylate transporter substrate binding protein [Pigmentiphaga soli]|uniref:Tripartite tricarboxylate transporter substrate binding protein n=1 Tax=Pigmentiphaga soli TaxID=1007095 RepID=A0ABP8HS73_9BURK
MIPQRRVLALSLAALALSSASWAAPSLAQSYPSRPVTLIIPYPPGSSTNDILGRMLAKKLSDELGQQVIPENRAGASGNLGSKLAAQSPPDGYTLLVGVAAPLAVGPAVYKNLGYDPVKDLTPIAMFATTPYLMVVNPSLPVHNVKELIALAKKEPGKLNFASSGVAGSPHLCGELFKSMAKVDMTHVPYKGGAEAMTDLLSGRVQMICTGLTALTEHVKNGRLRAVGLASLKRSEQLPDVPTISEQGLDGFEVNSWTALFAPAGTPAPIVQRLYQAVARIIKQPDVDAFLLKQGSEPALMDPARLGAYLKADTAKWGALVRSTGMTAE